MKRYNILTLMTAVLYVAIGLGALFNPNDKWIWVSVVFSLTAVILAIATVMAFASDGRARMAWTGFAVCGWSYLLLFFRQMSLGRNEGPLLVTSLIFQEIFEWTSLRFTDVSAFIAICHSLFTLLLGLAGAAGMFPCRHEVVARAPSGRAARSGLLRGCPAVAESELLAGLTFLEIQLVENQVFRVWSNRSRR